MIELLNNENVGTILIEVGGGSGGGSVEWVDVMNKPTFIGAGNTQLNARNAIGAGTSNLELGTTSTTAKAGDYTPSVSDVTGLNAVLSNKVDKVSGKSLIADSEISRLSTVTNQDVSGIGINASAISSLQTSKVDKSPGLGLSQENYTTAEKSKLASFTAIFTTALKNAYDGAVNWIASNGANLIAHLTRTDNPHNVTKTQVGLGNVPNTDFTAAVANKLDKDGVKVLSDVNFSTAKDSKLNGIATGAQVNAIDSITTTGTSGAATLVGKVLNIPQYSGGGGGSVSSVNNKTGTVVLDTGDIADVSGKRYQTDEQKANNDATSPVQGQLNNKVDKSGTKQLSDENYTTAEKNKLASITEIFTTALKNAYDGAVSWIATNGANLTAHLTLTNNPHNVTKAQVGLGSTADGATVNATDANLRDRATHTGTQSLTTISGVATNRILGRTTAGVGTPEELQGVGLTIADGKVTVNFTNPITGYNGASGVNTPLLATDTLLAALQNLQKQISSGGGGGTTTDASLLTSGTLADARLSANVPILETVGANKVVKKENLRVVQWGAGIEDYTDVNGESSGKISTSWLDTYIATPLGLKANLASPTFTGTVGGITKSMVGLSSVDNTADTAKPVSTAQQTAINAKVADNLTASTTVAPSKTAVNTGLGLKANIASPTFTGTAAAPTATQGTATTQLATTAFVDVAVKTLLINTPTASYTLVLADAGKNVRMNVATANTLTIPLNATVAFPIGTQLVFKQAGAGQTTLTPISGVTLNSASGLKTRAQHSGGTLIKVGTNEWDVMGDLAI